MSIEGSRSDTALKRAQLILAVGVGVVTLIVGGYNAKNVLFSKPVRPGNLAVTVVSAEQNQPVAGAAVELYTAQNAAVATAQTDTQGEYHQQGLAAGAYNLKVTHGGFEPAFLPVSIESDKVSTFRLSLRAIGSPVRAAIEDVGASWIKRLGTPKTDTKDSNTP